MSFETAVCVLLPTHNTIEEILAISRRNDFTQWGIPGGKVDLGESNIQAAIREIREEVGLCLMAHELEPIYVGPCYGKDGRDFWVTSYLYRGMFKPEGVVAEAGLKIQPMELLTLCNEVHSPFAPYNRNVISAWRMFK